MLEVLTKFGSVDALEPYSEASTNIIERGAEKHYTDTDEIEPGKRYELITLFDVLEHIEKDAETLESLSEAYLTDNGRILITVPAYNWLWSKHDDQNHHFRRYTKKAISVVSEKANMKIEQSGYFMTILFPIAAIARLLSRIIPWNTKGYDEEYIGRMNNVFYRIVSSEKKAAAKGILFYGLSVYAVMKKM